MRIIFLDIQAISNECLIDSAFTVFYILIDLYLKEFLKKLLKILNQTLYWHHKKSCIQTKL